MTFQGANPFLKQSKADRGWTVSFEVSQDQYDLIKDLPTPQFQDQMLRITVEQEGESDPLMN